MPCINGQFAKSGTRKRKLTYFRKIYISKVSKTVV